MAVDRLDTYMGLLLPIEYEVRRAARCGDATVSRQLIERHAAALKTQIEFDYERLCAREEADKPAAKRKRQPLTLDVFDPLNATGADRTLLDKEITIVRSDAFLKLLSERDATIAELQCKLVTLMERNDMLVKRIKEIDDGDVED